MDIVSVPHVAGDDDHDPDDDSDDEQEVACQDGHQIGHHEAGARVPIIIIGDVMSWRCYLRYVSIRSWPGTITVKQ